MEEREADRKPAKGKRNIPVVAFGNALVRRAVEPIASLRHSRRRLISRDAGGKLLAFTLKVAALEIVRRQSVARFPQLWRAIQALPLLRAPPLSWLQHIACLQFLFKGSQVFSKPIMLLSLATSIADKIDELKAAELSTITEDQITINNDLSNGDRAAHGTLTLWSGNIESEPRDAQGSENEDNNLLMVKEELEKGGVKLPERISDDELERFLVAANGNVKRCAAVVKRNVRWRESFYFFSPYELENWSPLVFWHGYDAQMRPSLVIRIGVACSILNAHERPRFVQAILSQVEFGVTHLVQADDPRITVVIDCEGTPALGFPVNMLKSCCARVQENYPTRLAALFVVNLPPVVHMIAQAIIQVLKPATKRKIHVEGDKLTSALAEHFGGVNFTPNFLGGQCSCSKCENTASSERTCLLITQKNDELFDDNEDSGTDEFSGEREVNPYHNFSSILRAIIIGFLMLWIIVGLLAGFFVPEDDFTPT